MGTPSGLLMPTAAAAMCNTFIPAAHLQHILEQAYPAPMTPESSPSAPSMSSNPTPPRNVTPDQNPAIVVTEPSGAVVTDTNVAKIPVGVLDTEPCMLSPNPRTVHSSPRRLSPNEPHNQRSELESASNNITQIPYLNIAENLPVLQKEEKGKLFHSFTHSYTISIRVRELESTFLQLFFFLSYPVAESGEIKQGDEQPLNLSRRPSESFPTPSPPLLTPHVKPEPPPIPGAGLQAAFRAYFPRNLPSTVLASKQFLMVPGAAQAQQCTTAASSPSVVIQKINQSGGEMTVSPDPKFAAVNNYSTVQNLVKDIKKEPGTEYNDVQQQNHLTPQYHGSSLVDNCQIRQKSPRTPSYDPISPCDDDGELTFIS